MKPSIESIRAFLFMRRVVIDLAKALNTTIDANRGYVKSDRDWRAMISPIDRQMLDEYTEKFIAEIMPEKTEPGVTKNSRRMWKVRFKNPVDGRQNCILIDGEGIENDEQAIHTARRIMQSITIGVRLTAEEVSINDVED